MKKATKKQIYTELRWTLLCVWWFILLGFIAPALVSADNTELVILGFVLVCGSTYITYRVIRSYLEGKK